ncbi:MAG: glycerol kinase GlpK [Ruminococcaceae bacterium]|nr:glycerol kinase GlpK [Oscillospiraceae bacterium]
MTKYVMALDQGTTSSRAIVFDKQGNVIAQSQREFEQIYPQAGWVEHNPMDILFSEYQSISTILSEGVVSPKDIACIGITNQRETTILWDKTTGLPIHNAPVWQCRRTAAMCEELKARGLESYIRENTGLLIDAYFSATKIKWLLDNVPGAMELAEEGKLLFGTVETWLIWNLTGGASHPKKAVHVTDYSNASRTMIFNVDKLCWDEYLCKEIGIPMGILPKPVPSSRIYGTVAPDIRGLEGLEGTPISGAIGDQPAALFGQACFKPGMIKGTYGTGCFLLMNTGKERVHSKNQLTSGVAWAIGDEVTYAIEGSAFNAGSVIQWFRDELHMIDTAPRIDELAESVPDTNGVYLVPALTGLGAPYWDMYARGCIVGLTRGAGRAHFARAVVEAICYQVVDLINAMKDDSGIDISSVRVDGGASVSNIMMQIQSDFLDCEVNRPTVVETTALGAAYLAGLACGVWKNTDEIEANRKVNRIFKPNMDPDKRKSLYAGWKKAVTRAMNWIDPEE